MIDEGGARKTVTVVCCLEGKVVSRAQNWAQTFFNGADVDVITEISPTKSFFEVGTPRQIEQKVRFSHIMHQSEAVIVVGDENCRGNCIPHIEQRKQIEKVHRAISVWNLGIRVIGIFIRKDGKIEIIADSAGEPRKMRSAGLA